MCIFAIKKNVLLLVAVFSLPLTNIVMKCYFILNIETAVLLFCSFSC